MTPSLTYEMIAARQSCKSHVFASTDFTRMLASPAFRPTCQHCLGSFDQRTVMGLIEGVRMVGGLKALKALFNGYYHPSMDHVGCWKCQSPDTPCDLCNSTGALTIEAARKLLHDA